MQILYILCAIIPIITTRSVIRESPENSVSIINELPKLVKSLPPDLRGKSKGDGGKVCIIGGSVLHSGPPYFAAITALKAGADNVYLVTPAAASPIIKAYSPDLLVYPYFDTDTIKKITPIIKKSEVIVIGPGLGKEEEAIKLTYEVINMCKNFNKPLVIDAHGLFAVSKDPNILKGYPAPVILTPNHREADRLINGVALTNSSEEHWYDYWGSNVAVLLKGETDRFFTGKTIFNWKSNEGGSWRRCPGQGDILAGALGTFFNWALKNEGFITNKRDFPSFSQSVACYAAAKFIRYGNLRAFEHYGRNSITSNIIDNLHLAFEDVF